MLDRSRKAFRPGHYRTPEPPRDAARPQHAERDPYDWITLWTAIIGVALVAAGTFVAAYQAVVMRQELDAALGQQRAWVSLEPRPLGLRPLPGGGAELALELALHNTGQVPATNLRAKGAMNRVVGAKPRITDACALPDRPAETGYSVLPNQTFRAPLVTAKIGPEEMEAGTIDGTVQLSVSICVEYESGIGRVAQRTRSYFWVLRKDDKPFGDGRLRAERIDLLGKEIALLHLPLGNEVE